MKTPTATRRRARPTQPDRVLSSARTELVKVLVTPAIKAWIDSHGGCDYLVLLLDYAKAMEEE